MRLAGILLFSIAVLGLMPIEASAQSAKDVVESNNAAFAKAFNGKDIAAVAAMYAEDAAILPAGGPRTDGRANIQQYWQGLSDFGFTDFTLKTTELEEAGNWAYEVGVYTGKYPDKDKKMVNDAGKYIVVWKKGGDGNWLLYRDIWNGDVAP